MAIIGGTTQLRVEFETDKATVIATWGAGDEGKYVDVQDSDKLYRWDGSDLILQGPAGGASTIQLFFDFGTREVAYTAP